MNHDDSYRSDDTGMSGIEQCSFAQLIRDARGTRSKYAIAKATGVSHGNLFGMERGVRFPAESTLKALCDFYGLDFDAAAVAIAHDKLRRADRGC